MALVTYPLNNTTYTAEDAELYNATRTSGVFSGEDFSFYANGANNSVTVGAGLAWIRNSKFSGKVVALKESESFDFEAGGTVPRIDVLAIQFDSSKNETNIVVKKGTPSANPQIPTRSTNSGLYELYLFSVYRAPASTKISNSDITDLRGDVNYCGYMQDSVTSGAAAAISNVKNGDSLHFFVGTKEEYEAQKESIPSNTFALFTDESQESDYVVEQGTNGLWTYRKWNSGLAELWGRYGKTMPITAQDGGFYRSPLTESINYPFPFVETPDVYASPRYGPFRYWLMIGQYSSAGEQFKAATPRYHFCAPTSVPNPADAFSISFYITGRWK